jgi:hypothetical protein
MTSAASAPIPASHARQPFREQLLASTVSYFKWGYGALLCSLLLFGAFVLLRGINTAVQLLATRYGLPLAILSVILIAAVSSIAVIRLLIHFLISIRKYSTVYSFFRFLYIALYMKINGMKSLDEVHRVSEAKETDIRPRRVDVENKARANR